MKIKTYTCVLSAWAACSISNAGNIMPQASGSGAVIVGPQGIAFSYSPGTTIGKNGQVVTEKPPKASDWSLEEKITGLFDKKGAEDGSTYTVNVKDPKKLDPESIDKNSGTVKCKDASTNIQGSAV